MSTVGRYTFGAGAADFATRVVGGNFGAAASTSISMWSAATGGSQYTDLLAVDGTTAITTVTSGSDGSIPLFYGPVGVTVMWADGGGAERVKLYSDPTVTYQPIGAATVTKAAIVATGLAPADIGAAPATGSSAYVPLADADTFSIDSTDSNGNPLQTTEHFGSNTRVTTYTWNTDGTLATERVTINGSAGTIKTMAYSGGVLTGWS